MNLIAPNFKTFWTNTGAPLPGGKNLISLRMNKVQINPNLFVDGKPGDPKEAILTIEFPGVTGPQTTIIPFQGATASKDLLLSVDPKYLDKLVFLGTLDPGLPMDVDVSLVESNDGIRSALQDTSTLLSTAGSLVPSGLPVPVGPILSLIGAILKAIRDNITDQLETYGAVGSPKGTPVCNAFTIAVSELGSTGAPLANGNLLEIDIEARSIATIPLADPKGDGDTFAVSIGNPQFDYLPAVQVQANQVPQAPNESSKHPNPSTTVNVGAPATIPQLISKKGMSTFNIEATSGKQAFSLSTPLTSGSEPVLNRFDLQEKSLFSVSLKQAAIPLSLSVSLNPANVKTDDVVKAAQSGAALAKASGVTVPDIVQKAIPSAIGLLSELRPTDLALLAFSGVLIPLVPGAAVPAVPPGATDNGYLYLPSSGANSWSGTLTRNVTYGRDSAGKPISVGTFQVTVNVVRQ